MKQLYELVTYPLSIIEDPFWDFVLMTIIGSLSFIITWNFVGETGIRGKAGSILHWAVRIIVMFSLYFIISFVIKLVIIICHMPLVTWVTIGISILLILLIVVTLKLTIFSKREKKNRQIDKQKNRYIILMKRIINYYYSNKNKFLKQEAIIDKDNLNDKYIYEEIENMLIEKKLITKDEKNNSRIEFETIIFLEKYVKESTSYMINMLVFIITFITLFISAFQQLIGKYINYITLSLIILVIILIFKILPKDEKKL